MCLRFKKKRKRKKHLFIYSLYKTSASLYTFIHLFLFSFQTFIILSVLCDILVVKAFLINHHCVLLIDIKIINQIRILRKPFQEFLRFLFWEGKQHQKCDTILLYASLFYKNTRPLKCQNVSRAWKANIIYRNK